MKLSMSLIRCECDVQSPDVVARRPNFKHSASSEVPIGNLDPDLGIFPEATIRSVK